MGTEPAPADFNLIAGINAEAEQKNDWHVSIPYAMGIIGTRSLDKEIIGIHDIKALNEKRIINGIQAVSLLDQLREDRTNPQTIAQFEKVKKDLGFGLLLKYTDDVTKATPEMIKKATDDTIPPIFPMFWSFRYHGRTRFLDVSHVCCGVMVERQRQLYAKPWLLRWAFYMLPAPWIAIELGWFVAEYGRQPDDLRRVTNPFISIQYQRDHRGYRLQGLSDSIASCSPSKCI